MRTRARLLGVLAVVALVAAACGGTTDTGSGGPTTVPPGTVEPSPTTAPEALTTTTVPPTTAPAPTTSTTTSVPVLGPGTPLVPDHVVYGELGLAVVRAGQRTELVATPVAWAADDRAGGVLYRTDGQLWWWPSGRETPTVLELEGGTPALVDGRPALIGRHLEPPTVCDEQDALQWVVRDLAQGTSSHLLCAPEMGDSWVRIPAQGGARVVVVSGFDVLGWTAATMLAIHGLDGRELDLPGNPYGSLGCGAGDNEPCDITGLLSPDGRYLAAWYRPDHQIIVLPPPEVTAQGEWVDLQRSWKERLDTLPARLRVHDLDTDDVVYDTVLPARSRLVDFDGRRLVVAPRTFTDDWHDDLGPSTIVDISGRHPPIELDGVVILLRPAAATTTATAEPPSLGLGTTGPWVTYLQQRLVETGAELVPDGRFGPLTDHAVRAVPADAGLIPDGVAGPRTWAVLSG